MLFQTELGANPLANSGIELGAFNGLSSLYVGMAEAKLTAVPKGRKITHFMLDCLKQMNGKLLFLLQSHNCSFTILDLNCRTK